MHDSYCARVVVAECMISNWPLCWTVKPKLLSDWTTTAYLVCDYFAPLPTSPLPWHTFEIEHRFRTPLVGISSLSPLVAVALAPISLGAFRLSLRYFAGVTRHHFPLLRSFSFLIIKNGRHCRECIYNSKL